MEPETLWSFEPGEEVPYRLNREPLARIGALPQAKLVHGVGFPVGGSRPPDPRHLGPLVETIEALDSPWASEHLGFNRARPRDGERSYSTGFLLPPLQTPRGAKAAAASIRSVSAALPVPFAVETGVNYLAPRREEMTDGSFVRAVVEAADCGILLDLHNAWANELNGRQGLEEFVAEIPLERVWEVHVAGGNELYGFWLDAHSGAVPEPLLGIVEEVLPRLPNVRALVFEILPTFIPRLGHDGIRAQLETLRALWERRERPAGGPPPEPRSDRPGRPETGVAGAPDPVEWEDTLGALVVGRASDGRLAEELARDPGVGTLRRLVEDFRSGMIADNLRLTTRLLLLHGGEELARELLQEFFGSRPPELFGSAEAEAFAKFLADRDPDVPFLPEVVGFEGAAIRVALDGRARVVPFRYEPASILTPLARGRLPARPIEGPFEVEVTPDQELIQPPGGVLSSS